MAYQHLFGSASGGTSGAGYKTLAATDEFYNVMSDDELSNYNNYSFTAGDEHPVKFCHYYKQYKQCFIQSAISFEYDYVGRNSSIAHTLVLSEQESRKLLEEHICPVSPDMFMNTGSDSFARPSGSKLPAVGYRFLSCRDREYNAAFISKFFKSDVFAQFILSIFMAAGNGYSVFVALPGSPREASFNAVRLMDIMFPAFPAEYKKKLGFMTHVTDTYTYEDVLIYFVSGMDLSRQYVNGAYCFDLTKPKPYVSGFDESTVREYRDLIRTVMGNILSYDNEALNECYDDILPKLDDYSRFDLQKINEIYYMWRFISGTDDADPDPASSCRIISSFYDFYNIVDNKAAFNNRINGYWEREIAKCRNGGYCPSFDVFNIVNSHYSGFGEDDKRQAQRIWSFVLIYTVSDNNMSFCDRLFSPDYEGSGLAADIFAYIANIYIGFLQRKDTNEKMGSVYSRIVSGYVDAAATAGDHNKLFSALGKLIHAANAYYSEMALDTKDQYELFSKGLLVYFEKPVTSKFADAGLVRKFALLQDLKEQTYLCDPDERGIGTPLGRTIYDHFHQGSFIPGVVPSFTKENIARMADDRKTVTELTHCIEECPGLSNMDMVALFNRFSGIICGGKDISVLYELNDLVNKPDQQEALREWVGIYAKKYPDMVLSLFTNSSCEIDSTGNMKHNIDYMSAYTSYYESIGRDREQMMRDLNRFIGELETDCTRPEYKELGLQAFKEPTSRFINTYFFDKALDRKTVKDNENLIKRFEKVKNIRSLGDQKEKRHGLFGHH